MLLIGVLVIVLFVFGAGLDGGLGGIISNIREQDPNQVGWINRSTPLYHSWWSQAAVLLAHIPLGLLPHIGNRIWALKGNKSRFTFLRFASVFGITLGMLGLGGTLARAVLGGLFAIGWTAVVSLATKPLPQAHLASLFRRVVATE